jgi:hypothetical protein
MDEDDLQACRCEHNSRETGQVFAKSSGSAIGVQKMIYPLQAAYLTILWDPAADDNQIYADTLARFKDEEEFQPIEDYYAGRRAQLRSQG